MNKFTVFEELNGIEYDKEQPSLYYLYFGEKGHYYIHKSKELRAGVQKMLDDVFRGMRGLNYPDAYKLVVKHCNLYPSMYKVTSELIFNGEPARVLELEEQQLKEWKDDPLCLNNPEVEQLKPEWMLRHILKEKCTTCIPSGTIKKRKIDFNFCPICGRSIKK